MKVTVRVPAKINLQLAVGPRRLDGYHDLATVYQAVSLYDDVSVERSNELSIRVEGQYADQVPTDSSNLAVRAVRKVAERYGVAADFDVVITKSIPVAAGLAGGSADAAGALVATDHLLGGELSKADLVALAAELGSDVPFALSGGTAIGTGRGELLTAAMTRGSFHWVLVTSGGPGLSTPDVYAELDRQRGDALIADPQISHEVMQALVAPDPIGLGRALRNDLQAPALTLRSSLRIRLEQAGEYGALGAIVSGSGPTLALLVRDEEHALDLTVALTSQGVSDPILRVVGPVPGARIIESR